MISHSQPQKQSVSLSGPTRIATPPVLSLGDVVRGWTVVARNLDSAVLGMQEVLARDDAGAAVVLRVAPDLDVAARMQRETDLARCHPHPQLVQIIGMVEHQGWPIQAVEHVDGLNLDTMSLVHGPLAPAAACRVAWQIALALGELHGRQPIVAHGALSTARVVVDAGGNARLRDLGRFLPQQSESRLSPERRRSLAKPSAADDIYALGLVVAEAALGHPLELGDGHLDPRVLDGLLPERLVDALAVLLAPAEERVRNVSAVVRIFVDLEHACGDGQDALKLAVERARLSLAFGGLSNDLTHDEEDELDNTIPENTIIPPADFTPLSMDSLPPNEPTEDSAPLPAQYAYKFTNKTAAIVSMVIACVMLIGAGGAYAAAASIGLAPKIALPRLSLPSIPSVSLPKLSLPDVSLPNVSLPDVSLPNVSLPSVSLPSLSIASPANELPAVDVQAELAKMQAALEQAPVVEAVVIEPAAHEPKIEPITPVKTVLTKPSKTRVAQAKPAIARHDQPKPAAASIARHEHAKPAAASIARHEPDLAAQKVKLVVEAAPGVRAAAEEKLGACRLKATTRGAVITLNPGAVKITSEPRNRCVERVLASALRGMDAPDGEPYVINLE